MGTHGLIGFRQKGVRKATWNRFDSYPTGLGQQIAQFILHLSKAERAKMLDSITKLTWVDKNATPDENSIERYRELGYLFPGKVMLLTSGELTSEPGNLIGAPHSTALRDGTPCQRYSYRSVQ